jgi:septal ring factor EnvC (AmiA/AmiB activator)
MSHQRSTEIVSTEDRDNAWVEITHRTDGVTETVKVRESAASLIRRLDADRAAAAEAAEAAKADAEKLRGELDEARAQLAEVEKFDAAAERAAIEQVVTARMRLDAEAKRIGVETTDEMSDHEIRCASIARINSDANTDGMSEEMVRGMYLSEFGRWDRARAERDTVATDTLGGERTDNDDPYAALRA